MTARTCRHCGAPIDPACNIRVVQCPPKSDCGRERRREWRAKNGAREFRETNARNRKRYATDPDYRAACKSLDKRNRDRHKDRHRERVDRWHAENAGKRREQRRKRYASDPSFRGRLSVLAAGRSAARVRRIRSPLIERQNGRCGLCGEPVIGEIHIDHVIPRAHGGSDTLDNLQAAHAACNLAKCGSLDWPCWTDWRDHPAVAALKLAAVRTDAAQAIQ